jgi:hypothetical protein
VGGIPGNTHPFLKAEVTSIVDSSQLETYRPSLVAPRSNRKPFELVEEFIFFPLMNSLNRLWTFVSKILSPLKLFLMASSDTRNHPIDSHSNGSSGYSVYRWRNIWKRGEATKIKSVLCFLERNGAE